MKGMSKFASSRQITPNVIFEKCHSMDSNEEQSKLKWS